MNKLINKKLKEGRSSESDAEEGENLLSGVLADHVLIEAPAYLPGSREPGQATLQVVVMVITITITMRLPTEGRGGELFIPGYGIQVPSGRIGEAEGEGDLEEGAKEEGVELEREEVEGGVAAAAAGEGVIYAGGSTEGRREGAVGEEDGEQGRATGAIGVCPYVVVEGGTGVAAEASAVGAGTGFEEGGEGPG